MNKGPQHVLHVFDPTKLHKPHDEVEFEYGHYVDIATTKGKDPRTLYFGTSKNSNLLSGIFLGDNELTSRVKDVSLISTNGVITLSVKYANDNGKLSSIKVALPSQAEFNKVKELVETADASIIHAFDASFAELKKRLDIIDSSVTVIDSSIADLYKKLADADSSILANAEAIKVLDSSYVSLEEEINSPARQYHIRKEQGSADNGYVNTYSLFRGDEKVSDSDVIKIHDTNLNKLEYDKETNGVNATVLPADADDETDLDPNYVKKLFMPLDNYDEHLNERMNIDSSLNDRVTIVETQLKWEGLE